MAGSRKRVLFGQLVTMAEGPAAEPLGPGVLGIEDGRVAVIGPPDTGFEGETLDFSRHLLIPGFVNAHAHLGLSVLAGRIPRGGVFADWIQAVVATLEAVDPAERLAAMKPAAEALARSGVTFLAEYLPQAGQAADYADLPFRLLLFLELIGPDADRAAGAGRQAAAWLKGGTDLTGLRARGLAPHAPYSAAPALFESVRELAGETGCPVSCHLAETGEEVEFLKTGRGPLRDFLDRRGALDPGWQTPGTGPLRFLKQLGCLEGLQAVHLNHLEAEDSALLSGLGGAVFCPGSTRWFRRSRWMPVRRLLDAGVPVGLGTDSLASNEQLDFMREIRLAGAMLPEVAPAEILWMATAGGARACGVPAGTLEPGQYADFLAFPLPGPKAAWWEAVWDQPGPGPEAVFHRGVRWSG